MAKMLVLDEFLDNRRRMLAARPSTRMLHTQGLEQTKGTRMDTRREETPIVPETKAETVTQMHYRPTGHQPAPGVAMPGTIGVSAPRPAAPVRPSAPEIAQGIAVQQAMSRIDPLDRFMAARLRDGKARPAEKLVMGRKQGMSL